MVKALAEQQLAVLQGQYWIMGMLNEHIIFTIYFEVSQHKIRY